MIIVRIYQALSEVVVETTASVSHDGQGNSITPVGFFIGREFFDATSHLGAAKIGAAVARSIAREDEAIAGSFGGLHQLL